MSVDGFEVVLVMAVFQGAIVQGFSGFAFSAGFRRVISALLFFSGIGLVA
jgi:hypothetical protein